MSDCHQQPAATPPYAVATSMKINKAADVERRKKMSEENVKKLDEMSVEVRAVQVEHISLTLG